MRVIQARVEDAHRVLGASSKEKQTEAASWRCGCTIAVRLGNEELCDWEMCELHSPLAPQVEIGGG